jgi:hypothetical protein
MVDVVLRFDQTLLMLLTNTTNLGEMLPCVFRL